MDSHTLCDKCMQLTTSPLVEASPLPVSNDSGYTHFLVPLLEERYSGFVDDAERAFRLALSDRVILAEAEVQLDESIANENALLLHKSLKDLHTVTDCSLCPLFLEDLYVGSWDDDITEHFFLFVCYGWIEKEGTVTAPGIMTVLVAETQEIKEQARSPARATNELDGVMRYIIYGRDISGLLLKRLPRVHDVAIDDQFIGGLRTKTIARIRTWLDECTNSHDECIDHDFSQGELPLRLIKIGGTCEKISARLTETSQLDAQTGGLKYATLSHCWGSSGEPTRLLRTNYLDWCSAIPFATLPRTFREAMIASRSLDIEYLWIDALCIIQDSASDWVRQAPMMKNVYSGCYVTLAATAATDSRSGLFVQSRGYPYAGCTVNLKQTEPHFLQGTWSVGSRYPSPQDWLDDRKLAPLNSRAWVFQERILSPRTINFASSELSWQCLKGLDKEILDQGPKPVMHSLYLHDEIEDGDWHKLVRDYSQLELTFMSDKLIAFSGVAERFSMRWGLHSQDYLAGLRRSEIHGDLLWRAIPDESAHGKVAAPIWHSLAPSWSWASSPLIADFIDLQDNGLQLNQHFQVINAQVKVGGPSAFGAVQGGCLRVRSLVLNIAEVSDLVVLIKSSIGYKAYNNSGTAFADYMQAIGEVPVGEDDEMCFRQLRPTHVLPMLRDSRKQRAEFTLMMLRQVPERIGTYIRINLQDFFLLEGDLSSSLMSTPEFNDIVTSHILEIATTDDEGKSRSGPTTTAHHPSWWTVGSELDPSQYLEALGGGRYEIEII